MALLNLIDRPENATHPRSQHGLSAAASACSHALLAAALLIGLRQTAPAGISKAPASFDARMVWIPSATDGGGRDSGGDQSQHPARRAQARGRDPISIPVSPQPSATSLADTPIETMPIAAVPMGHTATQLAGSVTGERPGDALGHNIGRGGDGDGPTSGQGNGPSTGVGDGVHALGPGVAAPIPLVQVKPHYTTDAMRAKVQGIAVLECVVLPDGTVGDARIVRSLDRHFGLDEEAIAAAKRWRFKPGMMTGRPVAVAIRIELTFTLR